MEPPEKKSPPLVLVILDGFGSAAAGSGNAITRATKPHLDSFFAAFPNTQLFASGEAVGLPKNEAGNSEVGHLNIGAGRVVYQELARINMSIADGSFLKNAAIKSACEHVIRNNSTLHLLGLIGSGTVHSSNDHLFALLWTIKQYNVKNVALHLFTDGRDSSPRSALQFISEITSKIDQIKIGRLASVMGRYWSMDRDTRWDRTQKAYDALVLGKAKESVSAKEILDSSYAANITDEFIEPYLIAGPDKKPITIRDSDGLMFFNFRSDRARQLTKAFVLPNFSDFKRERFLKNILFVSMTEYEKGLPTVIAFPHQEVVYPLSAVISSENLNQLHIGETEKYAHVTYFFNGGREDPFPGEDRIHIPSPKIATYDKKPEMSAYEITNVVLDRLRAKMYPFYVINFANADMVAHTGSINATISAIETIDKCLGLISSEVLPSGGSMIITADHGNAEQMINYSTGEQNTEHTSNPVPFIVLTEELRMRAGRELQSGVLADVAPTVLSLLGIKIPSFMAGRNLLARI